MTALQQQLQEDSAHSGVLQTVLRQELAQLRALLRKMQQGSGFGEAFDEYDATVSIVQAVAEVQHLPRQAHDTQSPTYYLCSISADVVCDAQDCAACCWHTSSTYECLQFSAAQIARLHTELIESAELSTELAKKLAEAELAVTEGRATSMPPTKDASRCRVPIFSFRTHSLCGMTCVPASRLTDAAKDDSGQD